MSERGRRAEGEEENARHQGARLTIKVPLLLNIFPVFSLPLLCALLRPGAIGVCIHDVVIVGGGPCGLAVVSRLSERIPAANFSDDEHQRYHWIRRHRDQAGIKHYKTGAEACRKQCTSSAVGPELDLLVLDATGDRWMARWDYLFKTFDISHLRSPMFFHVDPAERDGLLAYTYRNQRSNELTELRGCVGKELSKHQRKKRKRPGRQPRTEPTVDERDRNDYLAPSTPLFSAHCGCLIDRYNLRQGVVRQEKVDDIRYGYLDPASETDKVFTVQTDKDTHYARVVVLAVGGNPPQIPDMPTEGTDAVTHAMQIKEIPSPRVRAKLAARLPANIVIVGGGLTSAQLADLAIRRGVTNVWLLMRGSLKVKPFDVGLEWVGKFRNFEQAAFWSADSVEERWEKIMSARNGGSVTPQYKKILEWYRWDPVSMTWEVLLPGENQTLPRIDHIYFATGVQSNFERLPFLRSIYSEYPINSCGGLPCITDNMAWRDDAPLFIAGRLAALQLGPGAPNLIGARIGAEGIAWSVQDVLGARDSGDYTDTKNREFDYLTARGSRYDALAEAE
ncbi:hypothetical protein GGS23DRAFT_605889 [Durotheca rogersii]|uniref:uncharacterized protein n=1 Tax=Durotheca rogersii TaxID=419775 RepID=UPI00221E6256|nr:uncharacterized protein GGS23DRAFT_605889 [Durotheca rogersii]KAI5861949.1 hypothetical protein GGS23DRAFT_605889 [Durotheca rogersii]